MIRGPKGAFVLIQDAQDDQEVTFNQIEPWPAFTRWVVLSCLGYLVGAWSGDHLGILFEGIWNPGAFGVRGLMLGACMGAAQAWMLKDHMRGALGWFGVTAIALTLVGFSHHFAQIYLPRFGIVETVIFSMQGAFVGLLQYLVIRRKLRPSLWWVGVMAFAYLVMNLILRMVMLFFPVDQVMWFTQALSLAAVSGYGILLVLEHLPPESRVETEENRFRSIRTTEDQSVQTARAVPDITPQDKTHDPDAPPEHLLVSKRGIKLKSTYDKQIVAFSYKFPLPNRPRAARLRVVYSGMSRGTQAQFRQHVQLNEKLLFELHPRAPELEQAAEYTGDIPVELFGKKNELYFVSRAIDDNAQRDNPFRLHAALIEFDW